ncbi:MAG: AbrB/MazE/SpoVT family DNA-binding domain-containing protein [Gemmatimonadales bacterium]
MVATVKLRKQGGSLAATLPADLVKKLGVRAGESLYLVEVTPGEFRLTAHDPATVAALKAHDKIMRQYRDAFRALAE